MTNQNARKQNRRVNVKADKLMVVILDFRQWSGTTVLRESDIKVGTDGKLPPKAVIAQLGQKNILDPKLLDRFGTIKARAVRFLNDNGVGFLGGYAVPIDKAAEVVTVLDGFVEEYEKAKADFMKSYDTLVDDWIRQNPEFAEELRAAKKSRAEVDQKICAAYTAVRVQPIEEKDRVDRFNQDVDSLAERLLRSVAQTAGKLSLGSFDKNGRSTAIRPVPTLRKISSKLKGLSFLDEGVEPIIEMIDALLAKIPADGRIVGPLFWETQAVVSVLADVARMKAIADGSLSLDLWRENFVPEEAKPTDELELVAEEPMPAPETSTKTEPTTETTTKAKAETKKSVSEAVEVVEVAEAAEAAIRSESKANDGSSASDSALHSDLDSELIRFIKARRPEPKPDPNPRSVVPAEPVEPFELIEPIESVETTSPDLPVPVIPAATEPEVPPTSRRSSFFF